MCTHLQEAIPKLFSTHTCQPRRAAKLAGAWMTARMTTAVPASSLPIWLLAFPSPSGSTALEGTARNGTGTVMLQFKGACAVALAVLLAVWFTAPFAAPATVLYWQTCKARPYIQGVNVILRSSLQRCYHNRACIIVHFVLLLKRPPMIRIQHHVFTNTQ